MLTLGCELLQQHKSRSRDAAGFLSVITVHGWCPCSADELQGSQGKSHQLLSWIVTLKDLFLYKILCLAAGLREYPV